MQVIRCGCGCGSFRCFKCHEHVREQIDVALDPPDASQRVFWCENHNCAWFGRAFIDRLLIVEMEEVKLELTQ